MYVTSLGGFTRARTAGHYAGRQRYIAHRHILEASMAEPSSPATPDRRSEKPESRRSSYVETLL